MGCCFSRSAGPNSPYPGGAPNSSARAINPVNNLNSNQSTPPDQQDQNPHRRRRENRPLDQHIDKPLRLHTWTSTDRRWSKRLLARERQDFFDTRVTGRAEIWQTVHVALRALWDTSEQDEDGTEALNMAQTILSAAEISLPTGNLANGVYDSLGNYYPLPEWIVCNPTNLVDDSESKTELSGGADDTIAENDDLDGDDSESRREEKGKGVIDVREQVVLRARLSENGRDYQVHVLRTEAVRTVAKKIALEADVAPDKRVRIAYMGKILRDNASLDTQGWQDDHIVNALVFSR